MYQDKKKPLLRRVFKGFQPSFSCNEKFTPKTSKMSPKTRRKLAEISHHPFLLSKPHFLLSKNDFSFLESNNQTLVALSLKLIFTPFWHSAPKGVVVAPQILDFSGENHPKFSFLASTFDTCFSHVI